MSKPSIHQSVFVNPEHEFVTSARWQDGEHNHRSPYVEVHLNVGDFQVCLFVDKAEAPKLALALDVLSHALLKPDFGVWCLAQREAEKAEVL